MIPWRNTQEKIIAAIARPGHLDLLRQAAKKQARMNEPIMPYSRKILAHVAI
jgi:hypothetical protein